MNTTTLPLRHSMNPAPFRLALLLIPLAFACFGLSPIARAVCEQGCLKNDNTVLGDNALLNNTGNDNTAIGANALAANTTGSTNTAIGSEALANVSTSGNCTAIGYQALFNNTASQNTAVGESALFENTTGFFNVAVGVHAMIENTTGSNNVAIGLLALGLNSTGSSNTAYGSSAANNTTGNDNTAIGTAALQRNTTGSNNVALGSGAGFTIVNGDFNIDIGSPGRGRDSFTIRIGQRQTNTYIAGISGVTVPTGVPVIVDADGHLGTTTSSVRFKEDIKPMDKASEAIVRLKPVTFRYKHELDPAGIPQFGLVAEDVAKVNPNLVARDEQGKPYTVRYDAVNAMLLNEFIKARRQIDSQQKQIDALTTGLQKVSAQLELRKSAPQTVLNNQ
jgi:hypothetical protein